MERGEGWIRDQEVDRGQGRGGRGGIDWDGWYGRDGRDVGYWM